MKVTLRKRNKGGKTSLYIDYYSNGKRKYEFLRLYLTDKPKTQEERNNNKQTLLLAETIRAQRQLDIQNIAFGFGDPSKGRSLFITYIENLAEKRSDSKGNYGSWIAAIKHFKNWNGHNIRFNEINSAWLEDLKYYFTNQLKTKGKNEISNNTRSSYFNKIRAAINQAVKDDYLKENPCLKVKCIKENEVEKEFLTLNELTTLAKTECSNNLFKNAFIFSALTGLRFSDVQKLSWNEIQFSNEIGYYIRFTQKKTKRTETLPISEDCLQFTGPMQNSNVKVFKNLTYSGFNNDILNQWVKNAGIDKHITFHCARHTFATLQLTLGTDIYTVSKLLGHKDLKTTQIYAKIIDKKKTEAASKIKLKL